MTSIDPQPGEVIVTRIHYNKAVSKYRAEHNLSLPNNRWNAAYLSPEDPSDFQSIDSEQGPADLAARVADACPQLLKPVTLETKKEVESIGIIFNQLTDREMQQFKAVYANALDVNPETRD
jgi:hypothetical protein